MIFHSVERAQQFLRRILMGRDGEPILWISLGEHGQPFVDAVWKDDQDRVAVVVRENRMYWSVDPAYRIDAQENSIALAFEESLMWRVTLLGPEVQLEGIFSTPYGLLAITEWGFLCLLPEAANRLLEVEMATPDVDGSIRWFPLRSPFRQDVNH